MSAHPRKMLKELSVMLATYGIVIVGNEMGSKHRKLRVSNGTKTATVTVAVSPSDHRAYRNIAKDARNALREAP
jgi:hypothetical protein